MAHWALRAPGNREDQPAQPGLHLEFPGRNHGGCSEPRSKGRLQVGSREYCRLEQQERLATDRH